MPEYYAVHGRTGRTARGGTYWLTDHRPANDLVECARFIGHPLGWCSTMIIDLPCELMCIIDLYAREFCEYIMYNSCCANIQLMIDVAGGLPEAYVRAAQSFRIGDEEARIQAMNEHTPRRAREIYEDEMSEDLWEKARCVRRENQGLGSTDSLATTSGEVVERCLMFPRDSTMSPTQK